MDRDEPLSTDRSKWLSKRYLSLLAVVVCLAVVLLDLVDGSVHYADIDDVLRSLQIRELLNNGHWFDRTLPFISMPGPYVSPWSRLIDLPYAAIALLLKPIFSLPEALHIAFLVWPPVLLIAFSLTTVSVLTRLMPKEISLRPLPMVAAFLTMILSIWQFTPGRIDHHNMQLLLFMVLLSGILRWNISGALLAGIALVLSVAVGLELLPLVAVVLAGLALCWIFNRSGSRDFLASFGLTVMVCAPLAALALLGVHGSVEVACDAYSAPYILVLTGYGAIAGATTFLLRSNHRLIRLVAMVGAGLGLMILTAALFPTCLQGPYQMVDPLSRSLWLNRVDQEHAFTTLFQTGQYAVLVLLAALALLLAVSWSMIRASWREGHSAPLIVFVVAIVSLVLAIVEARFLHFATAFAGLFVPLMLAVVSSRQCIDRRAMALVTALVFVFSIGGFVLAPPQREPDVVDYMAADLCTKPDTSGLKQLAPGRIMASTSLGLYMAVAGLPSGFTVGGISFHRSSPGIRRIFEALALEDPKARKQALSSSDYVAVCRFPVDPSISSSHPFAALSRGEGWPGLVPLPDASRGRLQIFSIDHAALR